jgi:branched-chain amino acid transport system permease protein
LIFINQILQGVLLGGYYALIACGLSFMFGVMGVINLAHGSLAVVSAYALYVLADRFAVQPFLGLGLVIPLMALVGRALQRFVLERSARGGLLVPVLSTFGLSIILDNLLFQGFGADTRSLAPYIGDLSYDSWSLTDDIAIGKLAALTMAVAIALLGGIQIFLNRTLIGRAIRATAEDPDTVGLVGVNARRVNAMAAAIAMATVAVAGAFLGMRATFDPYAGATQLIFAFEAAVIGRAGSLWGTLIGGIVLGVAQSLGALISPQGFFIAGHVAFLAVLFARLLLGAFALRVRTTVIGGTRP